MAEKKYQCAVCGTRNRNAWHDCWYAGCPDGRDGPPTIVDTGDELHQILGEALSQQLGAEK